MITTQAFLQTRERYRSRTLDRSLASIERRPYRTEMSGSDEICVTSFFFFLQYFRTWLLLFMNR